ncbi:hypothetical protein [Pontixanthobacter aquaemixtae]|uniref:Uncharacterized protein n=1 Tax=Pontixanthobacter aquaemixtae TaxID=1958940 RepID=A0A844ZR59_9SPHN|nr:hypothetical protein [Pontixanthobacter aquaemixtae]MXO89570.1 hypothetical protein [Pontixanthobacter aquaemixtae]
MSTKTALYLTSASLFAMATALPASPNPGSVRDFQLPPAPTPTPSPRVQGPVDTEGAVPVAPRVIPTPTPSPAPASTQTPRPTATPTPSQTSSARPAPVPSATESAARRPQQQPSLSSQAPTVPGAVATDSLTPSQIQDDTSSSATDLLPTGQASLPTGVGPVQAQSGAADSADSSSSGYVMWLALLTGFIVLIGGAMVFWRRRQPVAAGVPQIEAPTKWVRETPDADDASFDPSASAQPVAETVAPPETKTRPEPVPAKANANIQIRAQAISLSRSLMNVQLSYQLDLVNRGGEPIKDLSIKADIITAHGRKPVNEQVASEATYLDYVTFVPEIPARETHEAKLNATMPVGSIQLIPQRNAQLYVPLLRIRIEAAGLDPIIRTFVVGTRSQTNADRLQPFRLDEMAQTYRAISLRALD